MGRPPLFHPKYGLSKESETFYRLREAEGLIPTDLAVTCLRNEEERLGMIMGIHERAKDRPKRPGRRPYAIKKQPKPVLVTLAERQAEMKARLYVPPAPVLDTRPPLPKIRISYLDAMARNAV